MNLPNHFLHQTGVPLRSSPAGQKYLRHVDENEKE
jgi:hypothetical protein